MKQLFYESFGSGRRNKLVKECINYISQGKKAFYILPSREAMFQVRRLFASEPGGISGCQVLGFDDLEKLLVGSGLDRTKIIGDLEERILLSHVLRELPEGTVFDRVKNKPGFPGLLIQAIRKLKRCSISPDGFLSGTAGFYGHTLSKCSGLYSIYSGYEKIKAEKGLLDVDDISLRAVEACSSAKLLSNTGVIVVDGFFNIDPVNIRLLQSININHPEIDLFANVPFKNIYNERFLMSEVLKSLQSLGFEETQCDEEANTELGRSFQAISAHLYSSEGDIRPEAGCLAIFNSPCLDHEIRSVAGIIRKLIFEEGIEPSDIAVVAADTENYKAKVYETFREYGVPLNVKSQDALVSVPVIKDLLTLWRLGFEDESQNAFLSVVASKYLLPVEILMDEGFETNHLYKLAEKIAGKEDIDNCFDGFLRAYNTVTYNELLKEAMEQYLNRLRGFYDLIHKKPEEALHCFKDLIQQLEIDGSISVMYREGIIREEMQLRDLEAVNELLRFIDRMLDAYESYDFEHNPKETRAMIKELLDAVSGLKTPDTASDTGGVRFIPPDLVRGQTYDTVFVLGVNEGLFPSTGDGGRLFDTYEARELLHRGINTGSPEWELEREKLRFNACVSSARTRLYLSFRTADEDGGIMLASPFIDEVISVLDKDSREMVVGKPVSMRERMSRMPFSLTEAVKGTSMYLSSNMPDNTGIIGEMPERLEYPAYAANIEFSREYGTEFNAFDGKLENPVLAQQEAGYGFSASQLNSYSRCPFIYFAERVLELGVEDDNLKSLLDTGTFYHAVLKSYHESVKNPCEADLKRLTEIFGGMVEDLAFDNIPDTLKDFLINDMLLVLQNFIGFDAENMSRYREVTGRSLRPVMLEKPFEITIGKEKNKLKGIIDRIDLEVGPDGTYTGRFILYDYKKGRIKGIKECIEGIDFQLPLYHGAVNEILKDKYNIAEPECLALLYYSIEKLEWNGIIRKDIKKALFEGRKGTKSTPARENMEIVLSWAEEEACTVMDNIRRGYFMPPRECPASDSFGCPYGGMCRYDRTRLAQKAGVK